ncbi:MAG: hypothetical protein ACYC2U_04205 [Candidatus Amoebophilus sp.]
MLGSKLHKQISYLIVLAIALLVPICCTCEDHTDPSTETDIHEAPIPIQQYSIWHTGNHDQKYVVQPKAPSHSQIAYFYTTIYDMYRVKHDGSCGFRAFLPILLAGILVDKKWDAWLKQLCTTIYEPAKQIIQNVDLSGTKYMRIRPTDNPDKLMQETKELLQKLDAEPVARKLNETEIQLLVKFMRQIVLMGALIKTCNSMSIKGNVKPVDVQAFDSKFGVYGSRSDQKEFWVDANIFQVFNVPYVLLLDPSVNRYGSKRNFYIEYYSINPARIYLDVYTPEMLSQSQNSFMKFPISSIPPIIMYQHGGGAMFEYLIPRKE